MGTAQGFGPGDVMADVRELRDRLESAVNGLCARGGWGFHAVMRGNAVMSAWCEWLKREDGDEYRRRMGLYGM